MDKTLIVVTCATAGLTLLFVTAFYRELASQIAKLQKSVDELKEKK